MGDPPNLRAEVERILVSLLPVSDRRDAPYACGRTKVYFRAGALERLETIRLEYFSARAVLLQSWVRSILGRRGYADMRRAAVVIQAGHRRAAERRRYLGRRRAALAVQCFLRRVLARRELVRRWRARAATRIQTRWRVVRPRRAFLLSRRAARILQRLVRRRSDRTAFTAKLAMYVEEARMDNKLSVLQQQVSDEASVRQASVRSPSAATAAAVESVDEKLLEEIEMMFDYLRKEIYALRGKNSDLRGEMRALEQEKRDLMNHAQSVEAASELSKLRVTQLSKTNSALIAEVMGHKQEISGLKREVKKRDHRHEQELAGLRDEFDRVVGVREVEVKKLKKELKDARHTHRMETDVLREEVERIQDEHLTEVMRLKNELRKTQDSHHDYLAKLMDVLETTHAARETETARINEELNSVRDAKDSEIEKLRKEIHRLKRERQAEASRAGHDHERKASKVFKMREELSRGTAARAQRARRFRELSEEMDVGLRTLQAAQGGDAMPRGGLLGRKAAKRGAASARADEEVAKLKQIALKMEELYRSEESSHSNVDVETIKVIDEVASVSRKSDSSSKLKEALRATMAENDALKRQLAEKVSCRACGYSSSPRTTVSTKRSSGWSQWS